MAKVEQISARAKVADLKSGFHDARAKLQEEVKHGPVHLLSARLRWIRAVIAFYWRRLVNTARSESTILALLYALVSAS